MQKTVIVVSIAGLAFAVVSLWSLRIEPASPLLALPHPDPPTTLEPIQSGTLNSDASTSETKPEFVPPALSAQPATVDAVTTSQVSAERRREIVAMLNRLRPQLSKDALDVWVDSLAGLSDEEIEFMLSQTGLSSAGGLPGLLTPELTDSPPAARQPLHRPFETVTAPVMRPTASAVENIFTDSGQSGHPQLMNAWNNLQNSATVGYRELIDLQVVSAGAAADVVHVQARSFSCGKLQQTGNVLHIALKSSIPQFFLLEDERLTRNGMFRRMPDGRMGLQAGDDWVALHDSPILPSDRWSYVDPEGGVRDEHHKLLGTVTVVEVIDVDELTTDDGVYFRSDSPPVPVRAVRIEPRTLELGNVDIERNRELLQSAQLFQ